MKPRLPIGILILIVLIALTFFIGMINEWDWSFFTNSLYWGLLIVVTFLMLIYNSVSALVESDRFKMLSSEEQTAFVEEKNKPFLDRLYQSAFGKQSDQEESDILMEHDYDGIHELDNKLPQWWLSLFYFGVFFLVFYIFMYAFTDFAHPEAELQAFNETHDREVAEYLAMIPQKTPEQMLYDASNIEAGKKIFNDNCVSCHNINGGAGGNSGANLTDDYWRNINKKELFDNIVSVVWNGSAFDKTMRGFGAREEILGNDIEKLAAYVTFLNQETNAEDGKEALGSVVKEWAKDPIPSDAKVIDVKTYFANAEGEAIEGAAIKDSIAIP